MSLADNPPKIAYPKLPFWDTVRLSYSTYFGRFGDAIRACWLWLILAGVFTGFASWQQWTWMAAAVANLTSGQVPQRHPPSAVLLLMYLDNIFLLFAGVSIAVAWHRLMILNERPGFSGGNVTTKNLWRYVVVAIVLFLVMFAPMATIMIPGSYLLAPASAGPPPAPAFVPIILLTFAAYAVGAAAAFRLTLLLPARAVGNTSLTFRQAWDRTRGNVWRLIWGIVVTTMPALFIAQIIFVVGMGIGPPHPGIGDVAHFAAQMTAMSTIMAAYYLLILPLGIGFISHAYRHFIVAPLEPRAQ